MSLDNFKGILLEGNECDLLWMSRLLNILFNANMESYDSKDGFLRIRINSCGKKGV